MEVRGKGRRVRESRGKGMRGWKGSRWRVEGRVESIGCVKVNVVGGVREEEDGEFVKDLKQIETKSEKSRTH